MFESISSKIEKALHTLRGKGRITDINISETVKEVRKALLDADVSYPIAKEFTDKVKSEAMGRNVIQSIEPGQLMVKIVHEKLTELMGSQAVDINVKGSPAIVLIAGLQGSGKTTFSAKLAYYLKNKKNKSVMLVAGDVYRPAAISQLQTLGSQIQVPVFTEARMVVSTVLSVTATSLVLLRQCLRTPSYHLSSGLLQCILSAVTRKVCHHTNLHVTSTLHKQLLGICFIRFVSSMLRAMQKPLKVL